MAKRKKKRSSGRSKTPSSSARSKGRVNSRGRWLEKQLAQVEELQQAQAYDEAFELLLTVVERYPRDSMVLAILIDVAIEIKNWRAVVTYSEQLYPLEKGNERAATLNNLIVAYMQLELLALACKTSGMLLAEQADSYFNTYAKKIVEDVQPSFFEGFTQIELLSERFQGDQDKMLDFMVEHDRMRFFAEDGQYKETIVRCRRLLAKIPEFIPALNNVSLAYFQHGDLDKAIETTQEVLAQQRGNFHALSNLTRYYFLKGERELAWAYGMTLKDLENDSSERWLKEAEALSYLGHDEGVIEAYLQSELDGCPRSPLLLHLAAAAYYRLGDESNAWPLWQEALRLEPSFYMAQASLADRAKMPHERDVGWYWPLGYWFAGNFVGSLEKLLPNSERKGRKKKAIQKLLKEYPQLPFLAPHILDRGDAAARKLLLSLIEAAATPELLQASLAFGLSPSGTDAQRLNALQFLAQSHPHLLPADRQVTIWLRGKQTEILLLGFHIHSKPNKAMLDDETYDFFIEAHQYLKPKGDIKRAEESFLEVIKAYPDFTAAYNQLALVYQMQGRDEQARTLVEKTHERFPDYAFTRMTLACFYIEEERLEEARALLNPVLQQKELHVSEFRVLVQAEILFSLAIGRQDSARTWLKMWKNVERDNPDIAKWESRIEEKKKPPQKRKKKPQQKKNLVRKLLREFGL